MLPEAQAYLHDIEQASVLIDQFRQGKTFDDYMSDALLRSGLERQLEIIGEVVTGSPFSIGSMEHFSLPSQGKVRKQFWVRFHR